MPQVDLVDSLVCGGCGDPKVACETTLTTHHQPDPYPYPDPDPPAESFQVPISGNLDYWLDVNPNAVYDREDSTKGTTNPKSHHHPQPLPPANSQRFSGNLKPTVKAPIIALPNKIQHSGYLAQSARKPQNGRIFPQKGVRLSDPGSPKVSCFGKVLSERERNRRRGTLAAESPPGGGGCWAGLAAAFRCFGRREEATVEAGEEGGRNFTARERRVPSAEAATVAEPPGLGGMKRFVSGRRAASWGGDVEVDLEVTEGGHVAWSGPLDRR